MKQAWRAWMPVVAAAGVLAAGAGCLRVDGSLSLSPSGAGTLRVTYAMPEERLNQLEAARDLAERLTAVTGGELPDDPSLQLPDAFDADKVRAHLQPHLRDGLSLRKLESGSQNGWRRVDVLLQFANIKSVAQLPILAEWGLYLKKNAKGGYMLNVVTPDLSGDGMLPDLGNPDVAREVSALLTGLRVTIRADVPGDILQTNAARYDVRRATWEFDYDKEPASIPKLNRASLRVDFEGAGLTLPDVDKKPRG